MAIDLLACTGDACRAGNLRALRCINHPATAYLHCMKPLRKSLLAGQKCLRFYDKFECIGQGGAHGVQKLNSATQLIQRHQGGSSCNLCITSAWMCTSRRSATACRTAVARSMPEKVFPPRFLI